MVKAFILVLRGAKKIKVFVKDIKELRVAAKRKAPAVPKYYDTLNPTFEQKMELSCLKNTEM